MIRDCEKLLVRSHHLTSELGHSFAQKAQCHNHKRESVLYCIAARLDMDFITFCSSKRAHRGLANELNWMRKHDKTSLEGYQPKVHILLQAAVRILFVAQSSNESLGKVMELFAFENSFAPTAQRTLQSMNETFKYGWREIFTGQGMRISENKYKAIRAQITPLLIYAIKNAAHLGFHGVPEHDASRGADRVGHAGCARRRAQAQERPHELLLGGADREIANAIPKKPKNIAHSLAHSLAQCPQSLFALCGCEKLREVPSQ